MTYSKKTEDEIAFCNSEDFKLGDYLYIGMVCRDGSGKKYPLCIGYKLDYAIKKYYENYNYTLAGGTPLYINKYKTGETEVIDRFYEGRDF